MVTRPIPPFWKVRRNKDILYYTILYHTIPYYTLYTLIGMID